MQDKLYKNAFTSYTPTKYFNIMYISSSANNTDIYLRDNNYIWKSAEVAKNIDRIS